MVLHQFGSECWDTVFCWHPDHYPAVNRQLMILSINTQTNEWKRANVKTAVKTGLKMKLKTNTKLAELFHKAEENPLNWAIIYSPACYSVVHHGCSLHHHLNTKRIWFSTRIPQVSVATLLFSPLFMVTWYLHINSPATIMLSTLNLCCHQTPA